MRFRSIILNFLLSISLFCVCFYISWHVNATSNFFYSAWYEVLNLDHAIKKYAPRNKFKHGFETTNKSQQVQLFSGIVEGIQNNGKGLTNLTYKNKNSTETLLTDAEVIHLQDVASLVNKFKYLGLLGLALAIATIISMQKLYVNVSKFKYHFLGGLGVIAVLIMFVFILGPTKIFYFGHELLFPNNHQWFFYYEESLMSTMMKAPALFGPIACQLLLVTVLIWLVMLYCLQGVQGIFKKV